MYNLCIIQYIIFLSTWYQSTGSESPIYIYIGVITFSPHELPAYVILPPRTTTLTKKKHKTTIFTALPPSVKEFR